MSASTTDHVYDAVVIGGGAAGVGVAVALSHAGIENFLVLERRTVGASFASWPAETRFITPSCTTNSIGMLDLNSVVIGTSPAYTIEGRASDGTGVLGLPEGDGDALRTAGP